MALLNDKHAERIIKEISVIRGGVADIENQVIELGNSITASRTFDFNNVLLTGNYNSNYGNNDVTSWPAANDYSCTLKYLYEVELLDPVQATIKFRPYNSNKIANAAGTSGTFTLGLYFATQTLGVASLYINGYKIGAQTLGPQQTVNLDIQPRKWELKYTPSQLADFRCRLFYTKNIAGDLTVRFVDSFTCTNFRVRVDFKGAIIE